MPRVKTDKSKTYTLHLSADEVSVLRDEMNLSARTGANIITTNRIILNHYESLPTPNTDDQQRMTELRSELSRYTRTQGIKESIVGKLRTVTKAEAEAVTKAEE